MNRSAKKYSYEGIILPLKEGDDDDAYVIMSILEEHAVPFNTKKRAPFKITVEVVKLNEIQQRRDQQLQEITIKENSSSEEQNNMVLL